MKVFTVETIEPKIGRYGSPFEVEADYLKVENGHLILRREVPRSYPETVIVFAPGYWARATLKSSAS